MCPMDSPLPGARFYNMIVRQRHDERSEYNMQQGGDPGGKQWDAPGTSSPIAIRLTATVMYTPPIQASTMPAP